MSSLLNYKWQQRQKTVFTPNWIQSELKKRRKDLSKKLNAIQTHPSRWIHEMDDDMFNSICEMLKSRTDTDIEMARDIIFKSKMSYKQIQSFTSDEYLCNTILNGPQVLHTWSYGDITI